MSIERILKKIIITIVIVFLVFEFVEHVIFPLVWLIKNRKKRSQYGVAGMIGKRVEIRRWDKNKGQVFINGELWRAECDVPLPVGSNATIEDIKGVTLKLKPYESAKKAINDIGDVLD